MNAALDETRLFDDWSLPVMMLDAELRFVYANKAYLKSVHRHYAELDGVYVFEAFPDSEERIGPILSCFRKTLSGAVTRLDAQPFRLELEDGTIQETVWRATQDPVRDKDGQVVGLIQRAQDITRQHDLEQRNKAIGYELSHRVKNIMAVVSSVARITGRNATNVEDFVQSFTARLNAMSRTNDLLALGDWRGLDVRTVFEDELSPFDETQDDAYTLSGPVVRLAIDATKDLSMVCHELATNATKYGCLKKPGGHLHVEWRRTGDSLSIDWRETCSHEIKPAGKVGFGTRLFDMLPYATVERNYTPAGLHLTIRMDGEKVFA
ncbi:HWE histidine kinase domain-containing protein [uncultured Algimonas sp.]|uniref:sensor histidine kinase n=1 Tax=uncultured Algimonas sp. TaxID=1547920 RepID=UPI00262992DB|nr:HWE histidine kinase domain-containing protein [uncultured Algimonas sp.]